jgi:hypothetical protein
VKIATTNSPVVAGLLESETQQDTNTPASFILLPGRKRRAGRLPHNPYKKLTKQPSQGGRSKEKTREIIGENERERREKKGLITREQYGQKKKKKKNRTLETGLRDIQLGGDQRRRKTQTKKKQNTDGENRGTQGGRRIDNQRTKKRKNRRMAEKKVSVRPATSSFPSPSSSSSSDNSRYAFLSDHFLHF